VELAGALPVLVFLPVTGTLADQGNPRLIAFSSMVVQTLCVLLIAMLIASGVIIALDSAILLATVSGRLRGRVASLRATTYNAMSRLSLQRLNC